MPYLRKVAILKPCIINEYLQNVKSLPECFYLVILWLSLKTCQMHWSEHTVDTERNLWYFFKWLLTITILLRKQAGHFTHWSKKLIYLLIANSNQDPHFFSKVGVSFIYFSKPCGIPNKDASTKNSKFNCWLRGNSGFP